MRYFFLALLLSVVLVVGVAGFQGEKFAHTPIQLLPDMDQQAKIRAQHPSAFFHDGQGARPNVAGVVPMGLTVAEKPAGAGPVDHVTFTHGSDNYNTGRMGEFYGDGFPEEVKVDEAFIRLGQERYNINCSICHGISGDGAGVTSKFGIQGIANLHLAPFSNPQDPTYRANGQIYEVITKGKGLMGSYGANFPVNERWAIVAWVRTLQMSRTAPLADNAVKAAWEKLKPATAPAESAK